MKLLMKIIDKSLEKRIEKKGALLTIIGNSSRHKVLLNYIQKMSMDGGFCQ